MTQATTYTIRMFDPTPEPEVRLALDRAYEAVLTHGMFVGGKFVEAFEAEWAEYIGTQYCVSCGNGFDALQLILRAITDEPTTVYASSYTCLPTWQAIRAAGHAPAPLEVDNLDEILVDNSIAVIVHLYGIAQPWLYTDGWLIEDCAQAHGASYNGFRAGGLGNAGAWSFYPTKNLGCYGDGGAITTDQQGLAEEIRSLRNYGGRRIGINSRLDSLQAAFLSAKLPHLDRWNGIRRANANLYNELLDWADIERPFIPTGSDPCWHQYAIRTGERDSLRTFLAEAGIETAVHYPITPLWATGLSRQYGPHDENQLWAETTLSLPVGPHIHEQDVRFICAKIKEFLNES